MLRFRSLTAAKEETGTKAEGGRLKIRRDGMKNSARTEFVSIADQPSRPKGTTPSFAALRLERTVGLSSP
jgi:hypothetical protein